MKKLIMMLVLLIGISTVASACGCDQTISLASQLTKQGVSAIVVENTTYTFKTAIRDGFSYLSVTASNGKTLDMKEKSMCDGLTIHPSSNLEPESFVSAIYKWLEQNPQKSVFFSNAKSAGCEPAYKTFESPLRKPESLGW